MINRAYRSTSTDHVHRGDYLDYKSGRLTNHQLTLISHPISVGTTSLQQALGNFWAIDSLVIWLSIKF